MEKEMEIEQDFPENKNEEYAEKLLMKKCF